MNKEKIERIFRDVGVIPVDRKKIGGREVFIGDGFSKPPHNHYVWRGAFAKGRYPKGCYVTWWFVTKGENKLDRGAPIFFEPDHDVEFVNNDSIRRKIRINAAEAAAEMFILGKQSPRWRTVSQVMREAAN